MKDLQEIKEICESVFGEKMDGSRFRKKQRVKTCFIYVSRIYTERTLEEIAEFLDNNHATLIHHIKNVLPVLMNESSSFESKFQEVCNLLSQKDYFIYESELNLKNIHQLAINQQKKWSNIERKCEKRLNELKKTNKKVFRSKGGNLILTEKD